MKTNDKLLKDIYEFADEERVFVALVNLLSKPYDESKDMLNFADFVRRQFCGNGVLLRGIIEFSSYCKNGCFYCGLNAGNLKLQRYRMNDKEILEAIKDIYRAGIKTAVLQSGEDSGFDWDMLSYVIKKIKDNFDMSITLSCGEQEEKLYEKWKKSGADRYLLKIETSNKNLYEKLHPAMSFDNRIHCLRVLKSLRFQTGSGMIVGLDGQTAEDIAGDILFFAKEDFDMVGINPFISHPESRLKNHRNGDPYLTIKTVALTRILTKNTHLPATTALGSILKEDLRLNSLKAGANVLMPNFTPYKYRKQYEIYPNKRCFDETDATIAYLRDMAEKNGSFLDFSKGDSLKI